MSSGVKLAARVATRHARAAFVIAPDLRCARAAGTCKLPCSSKANNLLCCDDMYIPSFYFRNAFAFSQVRGCTCGARGACDSSLAEGARLPQHWRAPFPPVLQDREVGYTLHFPSEAGSVLWEVRVHGARASSRDTQRCCICPAWPPTARRVRPAAHERLAGSFYQPMSFRNYPFDSFDLLVRRCRGEAAGRAGRACVRALSAHC